MMGSARRSRSYGLTHGSMPLQPDMPASKASIINALHIPCLLMFILQAYPGADTLTVKRCSEEHRQPDRALKIVRGFLFAEHIDVIKVITKVQMECQRICQDKAVTGPEIHRESIITGKTR